MKGWTGQRHGPRPNVPKQSLPSGSRRRSVGPARRLLKRAVWLVVLCVGGWGSAVAYRAAGPVVADWFEVREVTVTGAHQVTRQEVLDRLGLQTGESLYSVHPRQMVDRLKSHPWIKDASLSRALLHTLVVTITERRPEAILRTPSSTLLLDDEGFVLSVLGKEEDPGLPLLVGIDPNGLMMREPSARAAARIGMRLAGLLGQEFDGRPEVDVGNPENAVGYIKGLRFHFGPSPFEEKWDRYRKVTTRCFRPVATEGATGTPGNGCPALHASADGKKGEIVTHCTEPSHAGDGCPEIDLRYPGKVIVRERG
ncbi:MAG: FtsQ-type POTRA domain-containing protein [Nitrospirae bacterium]|nr:FtsQ-type POTRA domain-containing protein [Nitrospirota bacterium]